MKAYDVVIYCPDTNFVYDWNSPDTQGIGSDETSIIRIAQSLGALGQKVTFYGNFDCEGNHSGVLYKHFSSLREIDCEVFIATTSGGGLGLSSLLDMTVRARLRTALINGTNKPQRLDAPPFDYLYAPSYFLKEFIIKNWRIHPDKIVVCYHGIDEPAFAEAEKLGTPRAPFGIVCFGYPAKGLDEAIEAVRGLRQRDDRFALDIYGGYQFHGQTPQEIARVEGINFKGLVGQKELVQQLFKYSFCLKLQEYQEPFGIAVIEAKRAGVIVVASKVGAHPETISDGHDGLLIEDYYRTHECREKAVRLIEYVAKNEEYGAYLRENAGRKRRSWETAANDYINHWERVIRGIRPTGRKFVVSGWYGAANIGDETVLKCTMDAIRGAEPEAEITAVSSNLSYTEKRHACRAIDRGNVGDMDRAVREADFVILGGGGLFQDYQQIVPAMLLENPCSGVTSFAAVPLLAKIYGKPLLYYAQGVGPLFSEESMQFTKFAYELADLVTVRDRTSFDLLKFMGLNEKSFHLTADPAVSLSLLPNERIRYMFLSEDIPGDSRMISVVVRFWLEKYKEDNIVNAVAGSINEFLRSEAGYCFVLVPFCPEDIGINQRIIDFVDDKDRIHMLKKEYSPQEIATFISKSSALIGMRFHSCVFAAVGHVPFIALNYDYKVETFAREMGLDEFIVELSDITSDSLLQKMRLLLEKREALSKNIRKNITDMAVKEKNNHAFLRDFMEEQTGRPKETACTFRDDYIALLQKQLASLNKELDYKEGQIASLRNEIAEQESHKQLLRNEVERRDRQIADCVLKLQSAEGNLSTILNTKIWKIGQLYDRIYGRTLLGRATGKFLENTFFIKRRKK